jgi:periplasmic divalent cation tolerance protein
MSDALLVYTTWPDPESARAFAREAVEAALAACVHVYPPIASVYAWKGAIEEAEETPMILKTTAAAAEALRARLAERHPYDLPAFVALPTDAQASSADFLAWIVAGARAPSG